LPRLWFLLCFRYGAACRAVVHLRDIYNRGGQIDAELNRIVQEAVDKKIDLVEIIPGKGSGQLKKSPALSESIAHSPIVSPC
jgi:hypothetical protein